MVVTCGRQIVGDEVGGPFATGKIYLQKPTKHEVIVVQVNCHCVCFTERIIKQVDYKV